ncbi:MAG: mycofactocin precursor MftA [Acidimicrobiales bacterium]
MEQDILVTNSPDFDADVDDLLEDELLVDEISIDGMCGVY